MTDAAEAPNDDDNDIHSQLDGLGADSKDQPMIGEVIRIASLLPEYENATSTGFVSGIKYLDTKYVGFRKVRRDGNCFYRSFLFSYLENLLSIIKRGDQTGTEELKRFQGVIEGSRDKLIALGFSEFTFEYFLDEFLELIEKIPNMSETELFDSFQEGTGNPDAYTWYSRLLTSGLSIWQLSQTFISLLNVQSLYYFSYPALSI